MRHGTCFRRRLSARHAGAAPHSAFAELGVVRRFLASPVNQNQQAPAFPAEFGIMAGLALGWSGQFPTAILALIAWFILRRVRPATPSEILLVTAVIIVETPVALVAIFAGYALPIAAVEILVVFAISLLLFFTRARLWAVVLLTHAGYVAVMRSLDLYHGAFEQRYQRIALGAIALRLIIAWLLISYIRRPAPMIVEASNASSNETGNA